MISSIIEWVWKSLEFLMPFMRLNKKANLVFLGLDEAGKSTLMGRLKFDKMLQLQPTLLPYSEQMTLGSTTFIAYDMGGHEQARRVWRDYCPLADGVVFIIDGSNRERFMESKKELDGILSIEEINNVPICVLVNKIDVPGAANEAEIIVTFGLKDVITGKNTTNGDGLQGRRPVEVFTCSVLQKQGYGSAFTWLSMYIK